MTGDHSESGGSTRAREARTGVRAGRLQNWALLAVSLAGSLVLAEVGVRLLPRSEAEAFVPDLTRPDPKLGWSLIPDTMASGRTQNREVTIRTDSLGLRVGGGAGRYGSDATRILLLGDSFIEGYGVPYDSTIAAVLELELGDSAVDVTGAGVRGWSTDQQLLFFLAHAPALDPGITILFFYVNDVCYNATERHPGYAKPRFVIRGDTLMPPGPVTPPRESPARGLRRRVAGVLAHSALARLARRALAQSRAGPTGQLPVRLAAWSTSLDGHPCLREGWDLTERLIVRLRDEVEARNGSFLVFWIPSRESVYAEDWESMRTTAELDPEQWSPTEDGERLARICARNDLECTIPLDEFRAAARESADRLFYVSDIHWTASGHATAARILSRRLRPRLSGEGR